MQTIQPAYFKPDIADFWDGVVFFIANAKSDFSQPPEEWGLIRMTYKVGTDFCFDKFRGNEKPLAVGPYLFMKYLTCSDIELHGWQPLNNGPIGYQMSMHTPNIQWFGFGKWYISFAEETRMLGIYEQSEEFKAIALHASCYCRDINRFLLLIKMVIADVEQARQLAPQNVDIKRLSQ
jgi:hypothetical protein